MAEMQAQTWKATPFTIERAEGKTAGTVIFRLRGPFTQRDMFASLAPVEVDNMLNFQSEPSERLPKLNILDLTEVPYMGWGGSCGTMCIAGGRVCGWWRREWERACWSCSRLRRWMR